VRERRRASRLPFGAFVALTRAGRSHGLAFMGATEDQSGLRQDVRRDTNMIGTSATSDAHLPPVPGRTVLIQQAFRLEWLTVAWMVIEPREARHRQRRLDQQ
jgi:hypothetical protein